MPAKRADKPVKRPPPVTEQPVPSDPFDGLKDDPDFQEFLSVQRASAKKRKHTYAWANDIDDAEADDRRPAATADDEDHDEKDGEESKPKKEFVQSDFTIKIRELPYKAKKGEIKRWFAPLAVTRVKLPAHIKGIAYVSFKTKDDMVQGLQRHKSILGGKQVFISPLISDEEGGGSYRQPEQPAEPKPYHVIKESVADTGRLYVRNLSYTCTSQDLEDLFSPFGELTEIYLPIDGASKKVKGFAFVTFMFPEHAIVAMDTLDKSRFQGRLIHILAGESKPDQYAHLNNLSAFKQKKESELQKDRKQASTWNTLFLGANAAADVMAATYNVKKSHLIADTNTPDSIAVRMALGETQIVNETKKFLIENGINLDAFTEDMIGDGINPNDVKVRKRSRTVILVKNLPVNAKSEDLETIFARFGHVVKVIRPVHGVTAIVQMQEEAEAQKAFNGLISYKLNHVPIYLEWAPVDVFSPTTDGAPHSGSKDAADSKGVNADNGCRGDDRQDGEKINPPPFSMQRSAAAADQREGSVSIAAGANAASSQHQAEGFRLFVKNISFNTTDESFDQHFQSAGSLLSTKVSRKKSGLSNGYGFVVYRDLKSAENALRSLQNSTLDGHCLQVQRSHVSRMPPPASSSPAFTASDPAAAPAVSRRERTTEEKMDLTSAGVSVSPVRSHKAKGNNTTDRVPADAAATSASAKLLVRNIPFEASQDEVEQVFSAFSGLKSVRMPKKLLAAGISGSSRTGSAAGAHRGFAFIEYDSRSQAAKAMESLSASTHLYGRRLVLEWAKQETENETTTLARDSLYDRSRVIGSDAAGTTMRTSESTAGKRFKKSDLVSCLRSASGGGKGRIGAKVDPLDFDSIA